MLANPLPEKRSGSSLLQQRGFAVLLRLFLILLAQQSFPLLRGWVGDSSAMVKASALVEFLLAPQPALAQAVPAKTLGLGADAGDQKVTLRWDRVRNSNPAITKWQYQQKTGTGNYGSWTDIPNSAETGPNSFRYVVTGLTNSTVYKFKVRAVNSAGSGAASNEATATPTGTKTITLTTNQTNNRVTEGDANQDKEIEFTATLSQATTEELTVYISWASGSSTFVSKDRAGAAGCSTPTPATADVCWPTSSAITLAVGDTQATRTVKILGDTRDEGDEYFAMKATATGWSGDSILITIVDNDDAPLKPPTGLTIVPGPTALYLSWTAPTDSSRTGWQVRYREALGTWGEWSTVSGGASATSHAITGLSANYTYEVELRATDGSRFSTKATGSEGTSSGVSANLNIGSRLLVDEGSSATYQIKLLSRGTGPVTVTPSCTATCDLTFNPTALTFSTTNWDDLQNMTVSAARDADATDDTPTIRYTASGGGYPAITETSNVKIKDTGTTTGGAIGPAQPTNVKATAGNRQVTLTWTRAVGTITGYEVRYAKGSDPWEWAAIPGATASTVSHTVTGLDGGSEYSFEVRAVNGTAKGTESDIARATPTGASTPIVSAPAAPTNLAASAGNTQVTLNWTKPSGAITGYKVRYGKTGDKSSATWTAISDSDATTVSHTVTGLDNGSEYSFKVRAVNSGGEGTATDWVTATPVAPTPAAPTGFSARAGDGQVSLSWTDPSDASITRYELRYGKASERSSATWAAISDSDATTVSHMVSSLENGEEYSFKLRAVNSSGNGAATDWVSATPSATVVLPELQLSGINLGTVPEGQAIQLTVTSNSSLTGTLPVNLTLAARSSSSFTAGDIEGTLGPRDFSADFGTSGSTTGRVTIPTTADAVAEGAEAYRITLNAKAGTYTLGSTVTADGTIGEQATPSQPTSGSGASAGAGAVTITWNHPTPGDTSVTWQIRYGPSSNRDNVPSDWDASLPDGWKKEDITPTTASALFELEGMGLLPGTLLAAITPSQFNHAFTEMGFVAGDWIAQSSGPGAVIRHTVRGLDSGVEYSFQVRSINGNGVAGTPTAGWITATPRAGTASNGSGGGGGSSTTTPRSNTPVFQLPSDLAPVTEGEDITLELTSSSPLTGTHEVSLSFSDRDSSGFSASDIPGGLGPRLFNAAFGSSPSRSGTITIPTSSDSDMEGREHYRIKLNAASGYSLGSDVTADGTLLDPVPAKPTGLTATPGHGQVTLNWDDPNDASITGWQVQYKEGDGNYGDWMDIPNATATTTSHTVTGLTNGTRYAFRLRAVNAVGAGETSDPVAATPLHPDAARAAKARKAALTGLSRATLSSATDVIGGRISGELNTTPSSDGSIGEQALGIVEDILGISNTALPSSLSMEGIGEQLWHQTFQLSPPAAPASTTADGQRAQAADTTAGQQRNWALWGAGDLRLFNGDDAQEQISYEGNLKTAWVGIDQQFSPPWRAGVAASFSMGESDYTYERTSGETAGGSIKSRVTAFYPYGSVQVNERLRLWGTAGVGFGELRHQESSNDTDTQQQEQEGDLRMQLALVGFEQQLSSIGTWDFSLAGDLGLIKTTSQWPDHSGLEDLSMTLTRARLGVDSSFPLSETTRGYLNLRGRMDGGELQIRELWIRAHSRLGKIPVVLTLLGLSSSLQCTTKPSNFPLWEEKVIFLAFWGVLLISRKGVPTEMLPPNPGVLIHDWRSRWVQPRQWRDSSTLQRDSLPCCRGGRPMHSMGTIQNRASWGNCSSPRKKTARAWH